MKFRRMGAAALALLALGSVVVACGDDDDDDAATPAESNGEVAAVTITATDDVAAKKFEFDGLSKLSEGGVVSITLENEGEELHDLQLVKASDGHTLEDMLAVVASDEEPIPSWVKEGAGIGSTAPGATGRATVDLAAGEYWYFCTESSGGEEEGSESIDHASNGMSGELTLEGDNGGALPDADSSVTAADYRFDVEGLKAGENTFTFSNAGKQLHHALALPLAEGATFADAQAALTSEEEPTGPPPIDFEKGVGTAVIGPGQSQVVTWDLAEGTYALICFMGDYDVPGPPHVAKGMIAEVKIS